MGKFSTKRILTVVTAFAMCLVIAVASIAVSSAGSTYDELFIEHTGDDLLIAFNNRYLIDSVKACSDEKIVLSMSSPLTSMNIQPAVEEEGEEEIFMLLPVRMKD